MSEAKNKNNVVVKQEDQKFKESNKIIEREKLFNNMLEINQFSKITVPYSSLLTPTQLKAKERLNPFMRFGKKSLKLQGIEKKKILEILKSEFI